MTDPATVVFVAPQGSGKTLAAEFLRTRYGCAAVVEEWDAGDTLQPGALHLCHMAPIDAPEGVRMVCGDEAQAALRIALRH